FNPRLTPWAAFWRRFAATPGKKTPIAALKRSATQNRLLTRSLTGHLRNGARVKGLQKSARLCRFILRIRRKNNEEESVFRGKQKSRHVEYRVIRHGQAVQCQNPEHCYNAGKQNRHLIRNHE